MLFLKGEGASALRRRAAENAHARAQAEIVLAKAQAILKEPLIERVYEPGRAVMLPTSRLMANRVFPLGVAFFLTGGQVYRRRLIDEMLAVCAFPDWNRAHFIDTAEMVAAVAIGRDWCAPLLTSSEKQSIDRAIVQFGLTPGLQSLTGGSAWTKIPTNWNIVCCGGLIVAASVMADEKISGVVLEKACSAMRVGLTAYGNDGGWPEGATYWEYATRFAVLAFAALESKGKALLTVDEFPAFLQTWRFGRALSAPSGMVFDSGDSIAESMRLPVYGWLAQKNNDAEAARWQWQSPGEVHPLDLLWYASPSLSPIAELRPAIDIFPDAGYATLQNKSAKPGFYLAVQGGLNNTNHSHLDLGTFILEYHGVRMVSDLGREDYAAAGYFDPDKRFTHFRTRTQAHNTINFDQRDQSIEASAHFVASRSDTEVQEIACRIDDPSASFIHYRGFALWNDDTMVVLDILVSKADEPTAFDMEWNIYTRAAVTIGEAGMEFLMRSERMHLEISRSSDSVLTIEPVSEIGDLSGESTFSRISLRQKAMHMTTIEAVFSGAAGGDHSARIGHLSHWLKSLIRSAAVDQ